MDIQFRDIQGNSKGMGKAKLSAGRHEYQKKFGENKPMWTKDVVRALGSS